MSISIDGKVYRVKQKVKYGEDFPKPNSNRNVIQPKLGRCLIYIISVGIPEWSNDMSVLVPIRFYITQIIEPNKRYLADKKRKVSKLKLVKG